MGWNKEKTSTLLLVSLSILLSLIVFEVFLRFYIDYEIDYYAAPELVKAGTVRIHPYGKIPINKFEFFDGEYSEKADRPRIGYFGDSVTYGVGAGYPFRFTEILDEIWPDYEHLNLSAGIGGSPLGQTYDFEKIERLGVESIVYVLNLNDVAVLSSAYRGRSGTETNPVKRVSWAKSIASKLDFLRKYSYLYNFIRTSGKKLLNRLGYTATGFFVIELLPEEYKEDFDLASKEILYRAKKIKERGFKFCVAFMPYEMQISKAAATTYRDLGIAFSDHFVEFGAQERLASVISPQVDSITLGHSIPEAGVGEYFVYNLGDKIDFNHPNRKGHRSLAEELAEAKFCEP